MNILALEASAVCASAAVTSDSVVKADCFVNVGLTHSQTLLPLVDFCLKSAGMTISDIDMIAVSAGPGSFTGVRIGIATVKGLAFTNNIPVCAVSTLESMAYNLAGNDCTALCVMDARCGQVYHACFDCGEKIVRQSEDSASAIENLTKIINNSKKPVILLGDGAELCYNHLKDVSEVSLAPAHLRFQRASGVATAAFSGAGTVSGSEELKPFYLRIPQAERELKRKR